MAQSNVFVVLSTWDHGLAANLRALEVLGQGGSSLDAAVAGNAITRQGGFLSGC